MCRIAAVTVADASVYTGPLMPLRPRLRRGLAAGTVVLALAPASAFAQGAGDDQYSDPFGSDSEPRATATPAPRAPAATPAPASTAAPAQTPAPAPSGPAATPAPAQGPSLPYTGFEDWVPGVTGAILLGAGLTLRRRLRENDGS
jgi:hypothetical protein